MQINAAIYGLPGGSRSTRRVFNVRSKRLNFAKNIAYDHDTAFQRLFADTLAAATGQADIFLFFYLLGDESQPFGKGRAA